MHLESLLAFTSAVLTAALSLAVLALLRKRFRIARRFTFALSVGAFTLALWILTRFGIGEGVGLAQLERWGVLLFGSLTLLSALSIYFFDIHLQARGVRLPPLLPRVAVATGYLLAGILTFQHVFPEASLSGLLATSAITSLVLGLALQPILGNFFAGLVISLEKPFRINDWIRFNDIEGQVTDITWRTTHLRTRENDNVVIPNARISDQEIHNYFYPHPLHLERVWVGVHYRTPPYRAKDALLAAASRAEGVLEKPTAEVYVGDFGESSITYELRVWIEDIAHRPRIASDLRSEIWEEFHRRGITIPFPIRTLEIEPRVGTLELRRAPRKVPRKARAAPRATLFVVQGEDQGRTIHLDGKSLLVGRSSSCDIELHELKASKQHFRIEWSGEHYVLRDVGSTHGTVINGRRVEEHALQDLDRIHVGETAMVFEIRDQ